MISLLLLFYCIVVVFCQTPNGIMHLKLTYIKLSILVILINLMLFSHTTYAQNEIKDCNGNPLTVHSVIVTSSTGVNLITNNCTFSNGALSAYLNCIRTNNPTLPATASLIVTISADPTSGISTTGLILLKDEILQKNIISNICNRVGSDTDSNNKINTIDLCLLIKDILGLSNINPAWKFYKSQNLSLTGIGANTDLVFPIADFPLATLKIVGVHNGNVNQVTTSMDTCVLLCKPDLRIKPGFDEVRKLTSDYFLLNKSCNFPNLSLQILNASGQAIGNEITQNTQGSPFTAQLKIGNTTQSCTTKLSVFLYDAFVNIDVNQINSTDSSFVDVIVRNAEVIAGYQISMKFDTTLLQFTKVERGQESGFNASNDAHYNGKGHVNISRFRESGSLGLMNGTRLFRIKFKRKSSTVNNVTVDPENVETLFFDINKNEYCTDITYLNDTKPPVCTRDTINILASQTNGFGIVKFTDYASDDFGTVLFDSGFDEFNMPLTNIDTFNCGTNILTYVTFKDANGQSKECIFRVIVQCNSTGGGDTLMCNIEEPVLLNNGSNNFIVKVEELDGYIYLLVNEQRNGINNILFTKINKSTGETWSYTSSQNVSATNFYIDSNDIYIVGLTLPFTNQNNSVLIKLKDNASSLDIEFDRIYNVDATREAFRGIIKSNNGGFIIMGHRDLDDDDNFVLKIDENGNIAEVKIHDFGDDQMWSGIVKDFDNRYLYFGEEANQANEAVIVQFNDSLNVTKAYSYFTAPYVRGVAVDFIAMQRVLVTDTKIILVNKDFLPLDVMVINGINANYNINGPIHNGNDTYYYLVSRRVVANMWFTTITKIQVRNNLMEINWTKKVEGGDANNQIGHLDLFGNDDFLYVESRIDTIIGSGNYDIMMLKYPQDSCKFENLNLTLSRSTVNPVQQNLIVTDKTIPNFTNGENGITNKFSCINYLPCKKDSCQSSFTFSTNCNRISLFGITEGFNNTSSITYNYTSTNTNFISTSKDTIFNYFGDLPEVIICLEASDGVCSATFCDTIPVTLPMSPVFADCPFSISLTSGDSCSLTFPINIPTAIDPCTEIQATVNCTRSDGMPLSASFPVGITTINCTASSVLGNEFDATCEFDVEILDETTPICRANSAIVYLDNNGIGNLTPNLINNGSSDECGDVILSILGNQIYNCVQIGTEARVLVVTDISGNSSSCQAFVEVQDTIKPICNGKILNKIINNNGNASFAAIDLNDNSSDNCGNLTFSASKIFFNCEDLNKTNMVILTVTDQSGNSSSCPVEVRLTDPNDYCGCLSDVTAPVCQSKNITLNLDASGNVNLTPELIDDGSFDVCSDITLQIEGASAFDCNSLGSQIVNLIVTDQANNTASCSADVIIQDKLKPTCSITPNFYLDQNGQVTLNKDHPNITLSDNCDIVNIISNPLMFTCNSIGSRFISLTVSDVSGNTNFCVQNITIRDTIKPTCTIPPKTFYLQGNGQVLVTQNQLNIASKDNCFGVTSFFNNTNYNCNNIGMNPVSAIVQDASGNMNTCFTLITIRDTIRPICRSKIINKNIGDNGSATILASELNNNSTDNCGNVTFTASKTIFNCPDVLTTNLVTLTVTDQSGNSASCPVEVTILDPNEFCACLTDETDPICRTKNIILDLDITGNAIITPEIINDGSFDACSDITLQIEGVSVFDCNSIGNQIVNLVVTDLATNVSLCPATVTVQDKILPNCILTPTLFYLDQTGNVMVTKENLDFNVSDNCSEVTTIFDPLNFDCQDTGPKNIIVSVLDASGNTNVCSTLITITDTIKPACSIESKTFYLSSDGQVNINQDQLIITSTDNCAIFTTAFNSINYNCNDLGVKNISATVRDVAGNTNTCSAQVTVSDTIRPTCSIPARTIFLDTNGQANLTQTQLNITANDNCNGLITTFNTVNYNCNDIGTKNIMATVLDAAGNTNTCSAQITIRDTIRPICIIKDTIVTSTDGNGAIVIFNGRATDNCAEGLTISYSQPADQFYPCGEYNIIMSARDGSGNTSTCPFKLTVKDCDGCCLSESSFMANTSVDFNLSADSPNADSCIIQFITPKLTECQTVTEISWGDGTVSRGSFSNAVDFTHQYTEPAIYEVCVTYEEANQQNCFNNKKCNSFKVIDNCILKRSSGQLDYTKIILVPNPTYGNFAISGGEIFTDYAIYDQLGREMVAKRKVESTNDISQLQNGVYFVRLTVGSINVTKRIIKIQ